MCEDFGERWSFGMAGSSASDVHKEGVSLVGSNRGMEINAASGSGSTHIRESMKYSPEQIRNFLASEIFWLDIDGDITSESAWHNWLQPKHDKERKIWLEGMKK